MSYDNSTMEMFSNNIPERQENSSLFIGDSGELSLDARRALIQLLSGPSLDKRLHPRLWEALIQHQIMIQKRLAELFLELVLDIDLQIAFIRQVDTGELKAPSLLRRARLTFIESVLLLYLRGRLTQADTHGERGVVGSIDIIEYLALYEKSANTDKAGFDKRVRAAIEKFKKYNLLHKIRGSDNRFEISPALKLLFPAEEIQALTVLYSRIQKHEKNVEEIV